MATHHVDLRRACPAPIGQLTASLGERGSKRQLRLKRSAPCPGCVTAFTRGNDRPRNVQTVLELARCQCPRPLFLHTGEKAAMGWAARAKALMRLTARDNIPTACGGRKAVPVIQQRLQNDDRASLLALVLSINRPRYVVPYTFFLRLATWAILWLVHLRVVCRSCPILQRQVIAGCSSQVLKPPGDLQCRSGPGEVP